MKSPVVLFVYNRIEHTKQALAALDKNRLSNETDLYIYSDNAKNADAKNAVTEVRKIVDEFADNHHFHSVTVIKAETNRGLADSIIHGVSEVIRRYGRVIVLEDDLVTSVDFLEYMNGALDYYASNPHIWSISGYTPDLSHLQSYSHDIYTCYRACSWAWATWQDRWETVDWQVSDYEDFLHDTAFQKHFNLGGSDLTNMLIDWHEGRNHSWAIRWCYQQSRTNALTVYPAHSRITNAGCDNSGTHTGITTRYDTPFQKDHGACSFENIDIDPALMKDFRFIYDFSRIARIKRTLRKLFSTLL
jgi:hypothetical protein